MFDDCTPEFPDWVEYTGPWTVCLFLTDRAWGGSEEGGWWFDWGEPEATEHLRAFTTRAEADAYCDSLRPVEAELNEGRPDIGSVLSRGRYRFHVCEGLPVAYPAARPHYD